MYFYSLILLYVTIKLILCQNPSPCPDIFQYEKKPNEIDRWYGNIEIKTAEGFTGLALHIILDRPADLLGSWSGETYSKNNIEFSINNTNFEAKADSPKTVRLFVKYNPARTIPSLKVIRLNGRVICTSEEDESTTTPTSSNINMPSFVIPNIDDGLTEDDSEDDFFTGDFARAAEQSQSRTFQSARTSAKTNSKPIRCGVVSSRATPLIAKGQDTSPGQWPWHVALYRPNGAQLEYICGGTLISEQHVLTAAHCVTRSRMNQLVNPQSMLVSLGKYNLRMFGGEFQDRGVLNIFVHPQYNATVYFNDIAVLKLSQPVELTNYVRPCCLWEENTNLAEVIGRQGIIVGWGFNGSGSLSAKLMQASMPVVSSEDCIYSNRDFFSQFKFEKNYCAGFLNGTTVCVGDSGGGMVFPKKGSSGQNIVWQIRGLVSLGVALHSKEICDPSQYSLFTDVAKYTTWIRQVLAN